MTLSGAYSRTSPAAAPRMERWWEEYQSEELNALVNKALADSPDINQTRARLEQAAAVARRQLSDLLPDADITAARETERGSGRGPSTFTLRGAAGYELDIWGKNRASYTARSLDARAAVEDVRTAAVTLTASIVEAWLRHASLREEETLLRRQQETNRMALDLQFDRYENGAAEALDVLQQREVLARTDASLPDILADQEILRHQLAVLTGTDPSAPPDMKIAALPAPLPLPDAGIPARLLAGRPDIEAAWLRLRASDWDAEAAEAARLPSLQIDASYSTAGTALGTLFDTWAASLAAALALPVIDGGRRRAEESRARAEALENFHAYRETVINAVREVEDELSRNKHQQDRIAAIEDQLGASRDALEAAQIAYANGDTDYLSVLNSMTSAQALERQLVQERRDLALDRVTLYRALGMKSWTDGIIVQAQK